MGGQGRSNFSPLLAALTVSFWLLHKWLVLEKEFWFEFFGVFSLNYVEFVFAPFGLFIVNH